MSQRDLPLPPSTGDLPFQPIVYCAHCGKVVMPSLAVKSNTHNFCSVACKTLYQNGSV